MKRKNCWLMVILLVITEVVIFISLSVAEPIHDAAITGDIQKIQNLLKDDPNIINTKDKYGLTPLHLVMRGGKTEQVLIIDNEVMTKMLADRASCEDFKEIAQLLLSNKADIDAKDENGRTPLHEAAKYGNKDLAEVLLVLKPDVNMKDEYGQTALHLAAQNGHADVLTILLNNKALVDGKDSFKMAPIHHAAKNGKKEVVEKLIEKKADPNGGGRDFYKMTPLEWAVDKGHADVVKVLLDNKAEVDNQTLQRVVISGRKEIMQLFGIK